MMKRISWITKMTEEVTLFVQQRGSSGSEAEAISLAP
jgi:hypothetical protein